MHPGANTLDTATIVKLTRTLAIIPITLALALRRTARARRAGGAGREASLSGGCSPSFCCSSCWPL